MKYQKIIVILMIIAIALILISSLFPSKPKEIVEIEIVNKGAMKINYSGGDCLYSFNSTIKNVGEKIEKATLQIKMLKNNSIIEIDELPIIDINYGETMFIEREYIRSCDYLEEFKIDVKD